jgi:hypothetical protein
MAAERSVDINEEIDLLFAAFLLERHDTDTARRS